MSIKKSIFKKLDKDGYITDQQAYKIVGKEPSWTTIESYKKQWKRLQNDIEFFKDKNILKISKYKGYRATMDGKGWYKMSPDYFNIIKKEYIRKDDRPDLNIETYIKK